MRTCFEGMSVGDANPDSVSASASVATVRSADFGVGTGKGAGDSAAASAPVGTVRSAGAGVVAKKPVAEKDRRTCAICCGRLTLWHGIIAFWPKLILG
jgi:hypothetical protein